MVELGFYKETTIYPRYGPISDIELFIPDAPSILKDVSIPINDKDRFIINF
jgi:hypothetical protein